MPRRQYGFTLIEVAVTAMIIGMLAALAMPLAETTVRHSKEQELRTSLWQIRHALDAYKQAWDEGRILQKVGESGYPPSLAILVEGVEDQKDPTHRKLRFLRRIPRDPLNTDMSLAADETWGKRSYDSESTAPQAGADIFDIYPLETGKGSNGIPYRDW
ncbi:MAG: type II secretion system protein [Nitrosomonadales bacterium]|nr:type II secretion system protein [Nitrosomonadales bacterium]